MSYHETLAGVISAEAQRLLLTASLGALKADERDTLEQLCRCAKILGHSSAGAAEEEPEQPEEYLLEAARSGAV